MTAPLNSRHRLHRLDDQRGERLLFEFVRLARHRRLCDFADELRVVGVDLARDVVDLLAGTLAREVEPFDDRRRVDVLLQEVFGVFQQLAGQRDGRRRAVTGLVLLCLCDLDDHRGRRVVDVHLLEDGNAVVRDGDVAHRGDEHLVHPFRPERRAYGLRDRSRRRDVVRLCVTVFHPLGVLTENYHRLSLHSLAHSQPNDCPRFYIKVTETRRGEDPDGSGPNRVEPRHYGAVTTSIAPESTEDRANESPSFGGGLFTRQLPSSGRPRCRRRSCLGFRRHERPGACSRRRGGRPP